MPLHYTCPRWASLFNGSETAVSNPFSITPFPARQSDTPVAGNVFGPQTIFTVQTRNPLAARITWIPQQVTPTLASYTMYGVNPSTAIASTATPVSTLNLVPAGATVHSGNNMFPLKSVYLLATSAYAPNGTINYAGSDNETPLRYFWMDPGFTVGFTVSVTPGTATLNGLSVGLARCSKAGVEYDVHVFNASGTSTSSFLIGTAGYYALYANVDINLPGTLTALTMSNITYSSANAPASFAHEPLPNLTNKLGSIEAIRILSAATLVSNTSAELYKAGKLTMYQAPVGAHWTNYATSDPQASLATTVGSCTLPANEGMYGYLKMACQNDYEFVQYYDCNTTGEIVDSRWPLFPRDNGCRSFLVVAGTLPTATSRDLLLTSAWGVEFSTQDFWYDVEAPPNDDSAFHEAIMELRDVVQFTENPLHLKEIWKGIKHAASEMLDGVIRYGPKALELAGYLAPLLL